MLQELKAGKLKEFDSLLQLWRKHQLLSKLYLLFKFLNHMSAKAPR
jgi:hypothetical protein